MIVTLTIILINFVVLCANSIPLLPLHCLYLLYLALILAYKRQPSSYVFSTSTAKRMLDESTQKIPETVAQCVVCHQAKPPRYYHCRHCSRCIYRLDHHCNFIGNCVGQYNFKVYLHFLVNAFLHSLLVSLIILWNCAELVQFNSYIALYWLNILPALFGTYENARLIKCFWTTVTRNQTLIESYKQVRGPKKTPRQCFQEYFGKDILSWLLPTFVSEKTCNLLESTFRLQQTQTVKQYTYADEYLYGGDDEDELEDFNQKQQ